jgi:ATP-dependent Clp endopeptidase proteolytic subunit ClpP
MPTELDAARIKKLWAEIAEIEARIARAAVVGAQLDARFAQKAELEAIALAKARRDETLLKAEDRLHHIFHFVGAVAADTVSAAMLRMSQWDSEDPACDMTITFNSPGGGVMNGFALFDFIRFQIAKGHKVTCIALGEAASMGGILLQSASPGCRVMAKNAWMLIHEVAFNASGSIGVVEDQYKFGERLKQQAADIFIERSGGKLTPEFLAKNWTRANWWLSANDALELGIVDEVR